LQLFELLTLWGEIVGISLEVGEMSKNGTLEHVLREVINQ